MTHLSILADQQQNAKQEPPNYRQSVNAVRACDLCSQVESYNDDRNYYCFRFHRGVDSIGICDDFGN